MTHITCTLTAKNRDQLRNPALGNQVWATFTFYRYTDRVVAETSHGRSAVAGGHVASVYHMTVGCKHWPRAVAGGVVDLWADPVEMIDGCG